MSKRYPKLTRVGRVKCPFTKDLSNSSDRTVRYEPRRVAQDVNVEKISKTYSSQRVGCPLTKDWSNPKASLLGTNPVELSKTKVPKEYPKPTRANE